MNDTIRTGPAIPGAVFHLFLPVAAAAGALLVPVIGWQIAIVALALLGTALPQSLGGWHAIACLAMGLLLAEPGVWQTMLAVLVVHIMHVLSALLPVVPWRGRVVIAALRPTLRRLVAVQVVAQPLTAAVMVVHSHDVTPIGGAVLVGAAALAVTVVGFLIGVGRRTDVG